MCDEEASSEESWRRLALQFDGHRMQALWHLKCLIANPEAHKEAALKFLASPPLSGEEVLAKRIRQMKESG